ncbi:hypothetical protein HBI56_050240 [Parastagonospora nodorum]|uniref:Uncharacterized protein n=1 Tax=Phaeosphaeria nodorum (strain SN15 / ATCC MYA-4574 / FGSC 10173) TaxID=321614 RepID=A0A7U2EW09_PHANO|nr:hypothetical protein HBH56_063170 [Parastagonospora nodorum]QRC92120.1 hypothetical protein JI435_022850 [Parastagonospora nodorum SN15]KAH3930692.1 hypothetical protein HBH54_107110 [Parastagonospora nodorum]KAH3954258.1 hypothetical protein HBH53_022050 [Parastagonospora nodorum]KAH3968197.1 hypothetical protein HBH51_131630 [Parastagonospora nodorum]
MTVRVESEKCGLQVLCTQRVCEQYQHTKVSSRLRAVDALTLRLFPHPPKPTGHTSSVQLSFDRGQHPVGAFRCLSSLSLSSCTCRSRHGIRKSQQRSCVLVD